MKIQTYITTYATLVALCMTFSMATSLLYTTANAQSASVQAVVEGSYRIREPINVSSDKTAEFEKRYGVHNPADMIISELMIVLLEVFILFILVVLYSTFLETKHIKKSH